MCLGPVSRTDGPVPGSTRASTIWTRRLLDYIVCGPALMGPEQRSAYRCQIKITARGSVIPPSVVMMNLRNTLGTKNVVMEMTLNVELQPRAAHDAAMSLSIQSTPCGAPSSNDVSVSESQNRT